MPESHTNRGFAVYAGAIKTDYGHIVSFHESSAAIGHAAWLTVEADDTCAIADDRGSNLAAHLSEEQALELYNAIGEHLGLPPAAGPTQEPS